MDAEGGVGGVEAVDPAGNGTTVGPIDFVVDPTDPFDGVVLNGGGGDCACASVEHTRPTPWPAAMLALLGLLGLRRRRQG